MNSDRMRMLLPLFLVYIECSEIPWDHSSIGFWRGSIRETIMTSRKGRNISAYLGIPYAKPPVGPLRFQNPEPSWTYQVLPGDTDGNVCPQLDDDGSLIGDEDCLYLNVYAPFVDTLPIVPYPTMVYFHGGRFVKGSGTSADAGPDYLMDRDIILVTVNYRLGVLGFLSTGDNAASGNFGLKDQVLALKWVQDNVIFFRGDPSRVTIFGQGAGGASTSLHALSPVSKGLFHQYISQSGTAPAFWASNDMKKYATYATDLGKKLNCSTTSSYAIVDGLRVCDVYSLVNSDDIFENEWWTFSTWGPTVERSRNEGAFLTEYPSVLAILNGARNVPAMIGTVADEGLILTAAFQNNNTVYEKFANDLDGFLLYMMRLFIEEQRPRLAAEWVESFFFNNTDTSDRESFTNAMTRFITSAAFALPFLFQMETHQPPDDDLDYYVYTFDYRGTYSQTSVTTGSNENIGVAHGDDLIYLFPVNPKLKGSTDLQLSESDEMMIEIMIDLWTSFAYTGTPMVNTTAGMDPVRWDPYTNTTATLQIGDGSETTMSLQYDLNSDEYQFWWNLVASLLAISLNL